MGFLEIENMGKRMLEQFPIVKRACKRAYQLVSVAISGENIRFEGEVGAVTPDDGYEYFYGYYDKSPWDANDRLMIALKAKQAYRSVAPKEAAILVLVDPDTGRTKKIAKVHAWNVQQGCMAQWMGPDYKSRIIYNDFRDGSYCSVIFNVKKMAEEKVLPMPIYDISRDGKVALSLDFSRLHRMRPGYGYSNIEDKTREILCPDSTCIWKIDVETGEVTELLKYTDLAAFEPDESMEGAEHKVNHLMISPNGKRFMVLYRWFQNGRKHTRLVTADMDGSDMYNLSDDVFVSHCYWKNDNEILSFLRKKETGDHYYLMKDKTQEYTMFWPELNTDGHCSYSPDGKYIITDTYPNRKRMASVYICTEEGGAQGVATRIARVFAPFRYDNDCRCDLHPRWNRAGTKVCIDSVHNGRRGLYVIPVEKYTKSEQFIPAKKEKVAVLMASYNGEKYLDEQMQSLADQKHVDVSVIVRDDGSTDTTTAILEKWKNECKTAKVTWYTGEHLNVQKGYYDLLKEAIKTDNDYFAFCDQDDVWDDDKLAIAISKLEKVSKDKPAMYYCGQRLVDKDLKFITNHTLNVARTDKTKFVISDVAGCTAVFNRKLVEKALQYEPEFILMHDSWLYKICVSLGGVSIVDESCHISYRQHGENVAGIGTGIKGKFTQIHKYIYKFEIQKQIRELYKGYKDEMTPEYRKLAKAIICYDKSSKARKYITNKDMVDFKNKGLNLTYQLKVMMRKL